MDLKGLSVDGHRSTFLRLSTPPSHHPPPDTPSLSHETHCQFHKWPDFSCFLPHHIDSNTAGVYIQYLSIVEGRTTGRGNNFCLPLLSQQGFYRAAGTIQVGGTPNTPALKALSKPPFNPRTSLSGIPVPASILTGTRIQGNTGGALRTVLAPTGSAAPLSSRPAS